MVSIATFTATIVFSMAVWNILERNDEIVNNPFHEAYDWNVCEDEFALFINDEEIIGNEDFVNHYTKVEYRFVDNGILLIVYENDYENGGDIFELEIYADYELMCATDR